MRETKITNFILYDFYYPRSSAPRTPPNQPLQSHEDQENLMIPGDHFHSCWGSQEEKEGVRDPSNHLTQ
jgi:hypothetical protein